MKKQTIATICLDPGHGGYDPGAVKICNEKKAVLTISKACRDYLKKNNVKVIMTREKDSHVYLSTRCNISNSNNADLFISIHANAGGGNGCEGFHTIYGGRGKILTQNILKELHKIGSPYHSYANSLAGATKTKKDTNGKDYFAVIRDTDCPASIIEVGFVDNRIDAKRFYTNSQRKKYGIAIAKGILKTLDI